MTSRQQRACQLRRAEARDATVPRHGLAKSRRVDLGLELAMRHARRGVPMSQQVLAVFCGCTESGIYCMERKALKHLANLVRFRLRTLEEEALT